MAFHTGDGRTQAFIMLMVAAGSLYAAARVATVALARADGSDPGRRAIAQWIPIAGATLAAICMGHADIALSLILGTSVGLVLLVLGMATWLAPMHALPPTGVVWQFLFPAALLVLLAGLSGHLAWWHALMMVALGGAILAVWLQAPSVPLDRAASPPPPRQAGVALILVFAMTLLGSILAVRGTLAACSISLFDDHLIYPGTFAAAILSPLLILPTLGTASSVSQRGNSGQAVAALMGTVFLNLCLLLPVAVLLWHLNPGQWDGHVAQFCNIRWSRSHSLPFDLAAWQIETVSLVAIGFGLIPVAIGRWTIGRLESSLLILAYGGYIIMLAAFGLWQM